MTILWLFIWWINGFPQVEAWNSWCVALVVCLIIDLFSGSSTKEKIVYKNIYVNQEKDRFKK